MDKLRWMRVIGDTIFALGAVTLGLFVIGLKTGWSLLPGEVRDANGFTPVPKPAK